MVIKLALILILLATHLWSCSSRVTHQTTGLGIVDNVWVLDSMRIITPSKDSSEVILTVLDFEKSHYVARVLNLNDSNYARQTGLILPPNFDFAPYQLFIINEKLMVINFERRFYATLSWTATAVDSIEVNSCNSSRAFRVSANGSQMLLRKSTGNRVTELFFAKVDGVSPQIYLKQTGKLQKLKCYDLIVPVYFE